MIIYWYMFNNFYFRFSIEEIQCHVDAPTVMPESSHGLRIYRIQIKQAIHPAVYQLYIWRRLVPRQNVLQYLLLSIMIRVPFYIWRRISDTPPVVELIYTAVCIACFIWILYDGCCRYPTASSCWCI